MGEVLRWSCGRVRHRGVAGLLGLGMLLGLLSGCGTIPKTAEESGGASTKTAQNAGYVILYRFLKDESRLEQIFLIQDANESIEKLIEKISERADEAHDKLADLAKLSPVINLDAKTGMPEVETKTREAIAATLAEDLLESEGAPFERALLLTQTEGLIYGWHLCDVLLQNESNAQRKKFLTSLRDDLKKYYKDVVGMLKVK